MPLRRDRAFSVTAGLLLLSGIAWPENPNTALPNVMTTPQIVEHMLRHNRAQADELKHYQEMRHYQVQYRGFSANLVGKMDVSVTFDAASGKSFRIVSQSGSKLLCDKVLKKAVASEPQNYAFLDSLAWAYYKQGQYAMAEDFERKASQRMSNDPTLSDHLGEIEAKDGKLQQAIADWQKSLQQYSTSLAPDADPADVAKVQHKLESARVRLAHAGTAPGKQ